jgi:hypothetical protein
LPHEYKFTLLGFDDSLAILRPVAILGRKRDSSDCVYVAVVCFVLSRWLEGVWAGFEKGIALAVLANWITGQRIPRYAAPVVSIGLP